MNKKYLTKRHLLINKSILFFCWAFFLCDSSFAQFSANTYYKIVSSVQPDLAISASNYNNFINITKQKADSVQLWQILPLSQGYYRFINCSKGNESALDIVNNQWKNQPIMAQKAEVSGQFWKVNEVKKGVYTLTTLWLGTQKYLSLKKEDNSFKALMQDDKSLVQSSHLWNIIPVQLTKDSLIQGFRIVNGFYEGTIQGFKIIIPKSTYKKPETKTTLELLNTKLTQIQQLLKPDNFALLTNIPIWIEFKQLNDGAIWFHPDKDWLIINGYPEAMEKCIEIKNMQNFINWQVHDQPLMLLHELAHAFHNMQLEKTKLYIANCYKKAMSSNKYNSVPYINGGKLKHYGTNNEFEFFAELTEAYFGSNDYYPFNREQLKSFDTESYRMIQTVWEN